MVAGVPAVSHSEPWEPPVVAVAGAAWYFVVPAAVKRPNSVVKGLEPPHVPGLRWQQEQAPMLVVWGSLELLGWRLGREIRFELLPSLESQQEPGRVPELELELEPELCS